MDFDEYETLPTKNFAVHMTAGAIAGVLEHCVMYPFDSVKVKSYFLFSTGLVSLKIVCLEKTKTVWIPNFHNFRSGSLKLFRHGNVKIFFFSLIYLITAVSQFFVRRFNFP